MNSKLFFKLSAIIIFTGVFLLAAKSAQAAIVNTTINTDQISSTPPFAMLGADNFARIVYYTTTGQLIYVQCQNQPCSTSARTILPTGAGAIVNGNVATYKKTNGDIRIFFVNNNGGTYTIRQINCASDVCNLIGDRYTLPVVGANVVVGFNRFSAVNSTGDQPRLLLAWQDNSTAPATQRMYFFNCTSDCATSGFRQIQTVQSATTVWQNVSLATSSGNLSLIDYWEVTSSSTANLKFYQCTNASCSTKAASSPITLRSQNVVGLAVGLTDITTSSAGFPAIVYSWKPGAAAPNSEIANCTAIDCSARGYYTGILVNDSNPKILRLPSNNLRVFTTRNPGGASSIKLIQCNATCVGPGWPEVSVEANGADWSGGFIGSDGSPRVVYNSNPGGAGIVLRMGCDLEGGTACAPDFTITSAPTSQSAEQGSMVSYSLTVTPNNGFNGTVTFSTNPSPVGASITASFSVPSLTFSTSAPQGLTLNLTPGLSTPVANYTFVVRGTAGAVVRDSASNTLAVSAYVPKPWVQTTGGDIGSNGDSSNSVITPYSNPAGQFSSSSLILSNFARSSTFNSAKTWLIDNYNPSIDTQIPATGTYYDYFWQKFGAGKAQSWSPTCNNDSTIVGGLPSTSCVLLNTTNTAGANFSYGGVMADNGVFVYKNPGSKPNLLYNIQYALDASHPINDVVNACWGPGTCAGGDMSISGNTTVIFIPNNGVAGDGKLQINRPIQTAGNKKLIFIVQGDVEINPTVKSMKATIITNGVFNDFVWLNSRNNTRYTDLVAIQNQLNVFKTATGGFYPFNEQTDTSDGCATTTPQSPPDVGWWWETWYLNGNLASKHGNAVGGTNWDGSKAGVPNFQYDSCVTPGSNPADKSGLRWNLTTRNDIPGYIAGSFELNNYLDPINGKTCPANCFGKNIATSKIFAYRYFGWWPGSQDCWSKVPYYGTCTTAYKLQFNVEDDGYLDRYSKTETILYNLCGGNYNKNESGAYLESGTGGYSCDYWPLNLTGSVAAQGGLNLKRDLVDDNNSSYPGHPPIPSESFIYDPSILYYFAVKVGSTDPLFAEGKTIIREERP